MIRRKPFARNDLRRQGPAGRPKPFAGNDLGRNIQSGQTGLECFNALCYNGRLQVKIP